MIREVLTIVGACLAAAVVLWICLLWAAWYDKERKVR